MFRALVGVVDDDTGTCDVFRLPSSARALAPGGQSLWSVCGEGKCAGPVNNVKGPGSVNITEGECVGMWSSCGCGSTSLWLCVVEATERNGSFRR